MSEYCQDCDKELSEEKGEHAHGCLDCHGTVPSDKLFWLRKELSELKEVLREAKIMAEFYGDVENWRNPTHPKGSIYNQLDSESGTDLGQFSKGKHLIAGNRARNFLEKHKEVL